MPQIRIGDYVCTKDGEYLHGYIKEWAHEDGHSMTTVMMQFFDWDKFYVEKDRREKARKEER